mgnify:CR=1 FL=1
MISKAKHDPKTKIIEPAPLSVRFSAGILDLGFVLAFLVGISLVYRLANDIPLSAMRYTPPDTDNAFPRLIRSLGFYILVGFYYAAWLSSRLKATPGMMALHMQLHTVDNERLGFVRAFFWFFTAFLPLMLGNYLVLGSFILELPLIHLGRLNLFSLLMLFQVFWFLMILSGSDKRAIHDFICGTKVDHTTRPFSHPVLKHIAFLPLSGVAVLVLSAVMVIAGVNLVDTHLKAKIVSYEQKMPSTTRDLWASWRNEAPYQIRLDQYDFSCAAHDDRFHRSGTCPSHKEIKSIISNHRQLIDTYWADLDKAQSDLSNARRHIFQESIKLTDLALGDFLLRFQEAPPERRKEMYIDWLNYSKVWDQMLRKPDFLHIKGAVSIQYNHFLYILPVLLDIQPDLLFVREEALNDLLNPIEFDKDFVSDILSYQYAIFNAQLRHSRIDYLPLVQPNYIRNQFAKQANIMEISLLNYHDQGVVPENTLETMQPQALDPLSSDNMLWGVVKLIYNPVGRHISGAMDMSMRLQRMLIPNFILNNSLKRMLTVILQIKREDIGKGQIKDYLDTLPDDLRYPVKNQPVIYNKNGNYLYHSNPNLPNLRRILPF